MLRCEIQCEIPQSPWPSVGSKSPAMLQEPTRNARTALRAAACAVLVTVAIGGAQAGGAKAEPADTTTDCPEWAQGDLAFAFPGCAFVSEAPPTMAEEVAKSAELLQLGPGMTFCEIGAANGLWATALGAYFMPGGRIVATVGTSAEEPGLLAAAEKAGIPASVETGTDTLSGLPSTEGICDVIYSRMVFAFVLQNGRPELYAEQFYTALKPGGMLLISDHSKPRVDEELAHFKGAGFKLIEQLNFTQYFRMGWANLMTK